MKKILFKIFIFVILSISFCNFVSAAAPSPEQRLTGVAQFTGLNGNLSVQTLVIKGVLAVLGIIGVVFLALMVYAGVMWMTARGEEGQIDKAKGTIKTAMIGLLIIVGSYAITNFVTGRLISGKGMSGSNSVTITGNNSQFGNPDEAQGCCVDWVRASDRDVLNPGGLTNKACRITTISDCKLQGEAESAYDKLACSGPQEGCWTFDGGVTTIVNCDKSCEW